MLWASNEKEQKMPTTTQAEMEDMLRRIRDLIFVRELLAERGATQAELVEYDAVIDTARQELADSVKAYAAAA
jgi:hypothetical protein